jgi:hypothetical protein
VRHHLPGIDDHKVITRAVHIINIH